MKIITSCISRKSSTFSRSTFVSAPNNICAEVCSRTFQNCFKGVSALLKDNRMRKRWSCEHFSLLQQLCVSCYIFQHDTTVLSSPFLAAKPAYVFVGRYAAHRPAVTATLICCCSGITEYNKNPKCSSFGFLCSASKQKLQSGNLKMRVRIPGPIHSFYTITHSAITL